MSVSVQVNKRFRNFEVQVIFDMVVRVQGFSICEKRTQSSPLNWNFVFQLIP